MRRRPVLVPSVAFLCSWLVSAPAPAEDTAPGTSTAPSSGEIARRHFRNAVKLYEDQNFAGALAEFEAAYAAKPTASSLQNIALCLKALYRYAHAADTLGTLLERHGSELSPEERQAVEQAREELLGLVGAVRFDVTPADATLKIDGNTIPEADRDRPILLDVGEHRVDATAEGYGTVRRVIRVSASRKPVVERIDLERTSATPEASIETSAAEPADQPKDEPDPPERTETETAAVLRGWYALAGLTALRVSEPAIRFDDDTGTAAGALNARGGYRFTKLLSVELLLEVASADVENACDPSRLEDEDCGLDYTLGVFRLGPAVRASTFGQSLRAFGSLGLGVAWHSVTFDPFDDGTEYADTDAASGYVSLELGGELNVGHLLLALVLSITVDGKQDLAIVDGVDRTLLYTDDSPLTFVGLGLRAGWSQWTDGRR